ncbi:hypothetical protein V8G54_029068 [Vigna mungo]|uniref:Transposase MuDR plant domain-containing protein n=1 Tax=Vigna mungo TaxID=3915 RepID=A0AAQ3MT74_VIGMU
MEPHIIEMIDWVVVMLMMKVMLQDNWNRMEEGQGEGQVEGQVEGQAEVDSDVTEQIEHVEENEAHNVEEAEVHDVEEAEVHDVLDFELKDVEEDKDEDVDEDEDVDDVEDEHVEEDEDKDVDKSVSEESLVDVTIQCDIGTSKGNVREEEPCTLVGECSRTTDNDSIHDVSGLSDIEWVSDELDSGPDSDEDDDSIPKTLFPTFSMPKSLGEYKWEVGTYFLEKREFTKAIRTYELSNGRNLKFIKNDRKRVSVKCLGGNGKCKRQRMEKIAKENPNMKVMDIRDKVSRKWNVGISRNMAFRERAMAKDNVEGSFKEQFRRIYDYGHELLRTNTGSTVKIKACKDSFISSKPIIGLDECFLKGKYGGKLLTTVQNKDSWTWFLELLIQDLGGEAICASCTFISDQQKGLLPVIQDLLPGVEQRFCVRHLYSYFRKKYPGKDLKRLISRFTPTSQCDTLVNNMCEGFNSLLVHSRSKPIITMLQEIRVYIMKRWATNRTKMALYQGYVCPKVLNKFQKESWLTRYWLPR